MRLNAALTTKKRARYVHAMRFRARLKCTLWDCGRAFVICAINARTTRIINNKKVRDVHAMRMRARVKCTLWDYEHAEGTLM